MNDDYNDVKLIFEERDKKKYIENLERAREASISKPRVRKQPVGKKKVNNLLSKILPIAISAILVVSSGLYIMNNNPLNNEHSMINMSKTIGALVNGDEGPQTIVAQNTYRVGEDYAYNHELIARDIINLEDVRLFDYALCCAYYDMGNNVDNKISYVSNIDMVIYNLKDLSSFKDTEMEKYISDRLEGINSMDEYLISNGYVDKNNNADIKMFKKAMDEDAENILNIISSTKGVHKNGM